MGGIRTSGVRLEIGDSPPGLWHRSDRKTGKWPADGFPMPRQSSASCPLGGQADLGRSFRRLLKSAGNSQTQVLMQSEGFREKEGLSGNKQQKRSAYEASSHTCQIERVGPCTSRQGRSLRFSRGRRAVDHHRVVLQVLLKERRRNEQGYRFDRIDIQLAHRYRTDCPPHDDLLGQPEGGDSRLR